MLTLSITLVLLMTVLTPAPALKRQADYRPLIACDRKVFTYLNSQIKQLENIPNSKQSYFYFSDQEEAAR